MNGQGVGMYSMEEYGLLKNTHEGSGTGLARIWEQLYNGDDSSVGTCMWMYLLYIRLVAVQRFIFQEERSATFCIS